MKFVSVSMGCEGSQNAPAGQDTFTIVCLLEYQLVTSHTLGQFYAHTFKAAKRDPNVKHVDICYHMFCPSVQITLFHNIIICVTIKLAVQVASYP